MKLKSLNCNFLSQADIIKLNIVNIQTTEQLVAHSDLETLSRTSAVQLKTLKLAKKFIIGQFSPFPEFGNVLFDKCLRKNFIIKTSCPQIDDMLSSGFYSSEISELTGATSTGKTQLCLGLIANMLDKHESFKCLYIDSNRNFCAKRLVQLIKIRLDKKLNNANTNEKLVDLTKQVKVIDCQNIFHFIDILFRVKKANLNSDLNKENASSYNDSCDDLCPNLLIVDNLTSLFNQFKASNHFDINFYLNYATTQLKYLANNMNMAIVVVTNNNDYNVKYTYSSNSFSSTINFNCLYNSTWKNVPNLIVALKRNNASYEIESNENAFKFEIVKLNRPWIKEPLKRICYFNIDESGLTGIELKS